MFDIYIDILVNSFGSMDYNAQYPRIPRRKKDLRNYKSQRARTRHEKEARDISV